MKFIDSHCHLHDLRIQPDISSLILRAEKFNVTHMVSCATMESNFKLTADLSNQYSSVLPCFGIHPWFVDTVTDQWKKRLENVLESCPSCIGETGLDFTDKTVNKDRQVRIFEHHLHLAREMERPINIHIRKAWDTFIHLIKRIGKFKVPGVIHSYSGSADMIPIFQKFGLFISFSGSITKPGAKKGITALKTVSKDHYVLETDTPYIYPCIKEKYPGRLNEPKNLPAIARIASERIGRSIESFSSYAYNNSLFLLGAIFENIKEDE